MKKIDKLDKQLASALREDPQITAKNLALALGVTEKTVINRLDSLSKNNLLKVTAQWSMRALGLDVAGHLFIHIGSRRMDEVVKQLAPFKEVLTVSEVSGWPGLYSYVVASSLTEFFHVMNRISAQIPGISIVESDITAEILKYNTGYGGGPGSQNWSPDLDTLSPRVEIDRFDFDLAMKMQADGRISNRELARQLGVSESKVRQRFKNLVSSQALRKATVVQPFVFDYAFGALVRIKVDGGHPESLCASLRNDADVGMVMTLLGRYNVIALLFGDSLQSVTDRFYHKIAEFPEVSRYSILPVVNTVKYTYGLVSF